MNTPTPWKIALTPTGKLKIVDRNGFSIANLTSNVKRENEDNAELIVRAVNYHDRLVDALQSIIKFNIQQAIDQYGDASKAESWSCVKVAREALSGLNSQQLLTELKKESNAND